MNAEQHAHTHAQTANDALVYVRTVKLRFGGDQGHVYEAFLDVMRDFKSGRCVLVLSLTLFSPVCETFFVEIDLFSLSLSLSKKRKKLTTIFSNL
jgi:hypothetical protein